MAKKGKVIYRYRKKKAKKRRAKDKRIPILPIAGVAVALSQPVFNALHGDYEGALAELGARFTGFNYQSQVFDPWYAAKSAYIPIIAGALGSKLVTKLGGNRAIKKIPFIGKYVKL